MIFHHIDYYCANCFTKPDIMSVLCMYVCMWKNVLFPSLDMTHALMSIALGKA